MHRRIYCYVLRKVESARQVCKSKQQLKQMEVKATTTVVENCLAKYKHTHKRVDKKQ